MGRWEGDLWAGKAKGTAGIFIDDRADERQAEVLPRIFGGHVGGFPALVAALFAEGRQVRGVERARITFEIAPDRCGAQKPHPGNSLQSAGMEHSRCGDNRREVIGDTMDSMGNRGAPQAESAAGRYGPGKAAETAIDSAGAR